MAENYYSILGISPNSTQSEINKAYKKMAMKWHPDVCKDKALGAKKMKEINAAYETLSDVKKKHLYDQYLSRGGENTDDNFQNYYENDNFENMSDFSEIFRRVFFSSSNASGNSFSYSYNSSNKKNHYEENYNNDNIGFNNQSVSKRVVISLTLEEWFCGCQQTIEYNRKIECKNCKSTKKICEYCRGSGVTNTFFITSQCHRCGGYGFNMYSSNCSKCTNRCVTSSTKFTINIPRFCQDKVRVKNYGDFNGIRYDDLEINIKLLDHIKYKPKGNDIHTVLKIGLDDLIKGKTVKLKYLDSQFIVVKVRKFNIDPIVVPGQGIKKGNLVIKLMIVNNLDQSKSMEEILKFLNCKEVV